MGKVSLGQYYTMENPFEHDAFYDWVKKSNIPQVTVLEPFAGSNSLINILQDMKLCNKYSSYDIIPMNENVKNRNTFTDFPTGYDTCVTPPLGWQKI